MTYVWLVWKGEYSDRNCHGVFSSEEKAQTFTEGFAKSEYSWEPFEIHKEVLDAVNGFQVGYKPYLVRMTREGDTREIEHLDSPYGLGDWTRQLSLDVDDNFYTCMWAKDETHAVKITNERRTKLIATGEWPVDK